MNNLLDKAKIIMEEKAKCFVDDWAYSDDNAFSSDNHGSFELLHLSNSNYYDYKKYERSLESSVRDGLVNPIFQQLFELHGVKVMWPQFRNIYVSFDNEAIENEAPFEFIVDRGNDKVGYRYTSPCWERREAKKIFKRFGLSSVAIMDWSYEIEDGYEKKVYGIDYELREKFFYSSLRSFFNSYFSLKEYRVFLDICKEAVNAANESIGLQTIPMMSLKNLSSFKSSVYNNLAQIDYEQMKYKVIDSVHKEGAEIKKARQNAEIVISKADYNLVYNQFVGNGLFSALIGKEEFAKSFITSEYMYHIFAGGAFDYTTIVCGYLKSIEQLAKKLLDITCTEFPDEKLWILKNKKNPKDKSHIRENPAKEFQKDRFRPKQVLVRKENADCFNTSMAPLIWFLYDNVNGWNVSATSRDIIHGYLQNYTQECRNEHFHKDNIYSWDDVENIRNNTILLMFLLIGGYKLSKEDYKARILIGAIDYSFDILYKQLRSFPHYEKRFLIQYNDDEKIKVVKLRKQDDPVYDADGLLTGCSIRFAKVDDFDNRFTEEELEKCDSFTINIRNMPEMVWHVRGNGEEVPIIF